MNLAASRKLGHAFEGSSLPALVGKIMRVMWTPVPEPRREAGGWGAATVLHAAVLHGNAGAAHHGLQLVALHELGQRAPERQNHAALAMLRMHAAASQLHHLRTPGVDGREVELLIAVQTAGALCLSYLGA